MRFILNRQEIETDAPPGMPVLDFVRDDAGLKGTKHACREGDCASCLVLIGEHVKDTMSYYATTSCLLPLGELEGRHLVTIEGLNGDILTPPQRAMVDHGASQCGFCTPGIVMAMTGYLLSTHHFDFSEALVAVAGNLCRCTGYASVRRAIADVVGQACQEIDPNGNRVAALIRQGVLPGYFAEIPKRLEALAGVIQTGVPDPGLPIVAGGTDLYVQEPDAFAGSAPRLLMRTLPPRIWADNGSIYLSATTTAEDLKFSPLLKEVIGGIEGFMDLVCSQPLRYRATVGGNIVNASPIGDMTIMLLALGAELGLRGADGLRTVPLHGFFQDYKQLDLTDGEIVEWIRIPHRHRAAEFNFEKVCKRKYLDIASVNSAACIHTENGSITEAHLSAGGVAPIPLTLAKTAESLVGKTVSASTAVEAADVATTEISPISDVRGSAEYKSLLLRQLILAHFHVLFGIEDGLLIEAST